MTESPLTAESGEPIKVEPRCPGCHGGDFADFDHYCDAAGLHDPAEFPAAFAAWMNALTGWDGPMVEASTPPDKRSEEA